MARRPAIIPLHGELAFEGGSSWELIVGLRERGYPLTSYPTTAATLVALYDLTPYDPSGDPQGRGFRGEVLDRAGGTKLWDVAVAPRGDRGLATATFTTAPLDGDTLTIGELTYTWRTDATSAWEIQIATSATGNATRLLKAIRGEVAAPEDVVGRSTYHHPLVQALADAGDDSVVRIESREGGTWTLEVGLSTTSAAVNLSGVRLLSGNGEDGLRCTVASSSLPSSLAGGRAVRPIYWRLLGILGDGTEDLLAYGPGSFYP